MPINVQPLKDAPESSHYKGFQIEPLQYIEANNLDFNQGNIIKYVTRYKEKGGAADLLKARFYIDRLIALEEARALEEKEKEETARRLEEKEEEETARRLEEIKSYAYSPYSQFQYNMKDLTARLEASIPDSIRMKPINFDPSKHAICNCVICKNQIDPNRRGK